MYSNVSDHGLHSPAAIHSFASNNLSDSREGDIHIVIDTKSSVGNKAIGRDNELDHTYNMAEYYKQSSCNAEQPQYNTLQRGSINTASTQPSCIPSSGAYDIIGVNTSNNVHNNCSTLHMYTQKDTRRIDSVDTYDYVEDGDTQNENHSSTDINSETNHMLPQDYEPIYHGSSNTQVTEPTRKYVLFDDEAYGIHIPASRGAAVQLGVDGSESTPYSEIFTTVKEETPTANKEVEYAKPLAPNEKGHTEDVQAKHEHFYHSLELSAPTKLEKYISGAPYSKEGLNLKESTFGSNKDYISKAKSPELAILCQTQTLTSFHDSYGALTMDEAGTVNAPIPFNLDKCEFDDPMYEVIPHSVPRQTNNKNPSLNKMHHMLSPEEVSCIGDANADPELLNHKEDTNTPDYSDPIVPECLDDINMANAMKTQQ